jgi:hypothetical protein
MTRRPEIIYEFGDFDSPVWNDTRIVVEHRGKKYFLCLNISIKEKDCLRRPRRTF